MVIERKQQYKNSQLGLSLIEVLVVLVILTIGILSVLRLFPSGFKVVRNAQNGAVAERLGESLLETAKQGTLPDAVYTMYTDANGTLDFDPNVLPDDLGLYTANGGSTAAVTNAYSSDLNKARYIESERFSVPTPTNSGTSNYILKYGPIYAPPANIATYLQVNGANWTEHVGDSQATPDTPTSDPNAAQPTDLLTIGKTEYLIDYVNKRIAFPPSSLVTANQYIQTFQFTIRGTVGMGAEMSYPVTLTVPSNYAGGWLDPTTITGVTPPNTLPDVWTPGTATVMRTFKHLNPFYLPFSKDPYEYHTLQDNPSTSYLGGTAMNMGVIQLNPAGAAHNGLPALQLSASYIVFDWHILHEDHDIPNASGATIRTVVSPIKKNQDIDADGNMYTGVSPLASVPKRADFMILDLDTGVLDPNDYVDDGTSGHATNVKDVDDGSGGGIYTVSYQSGRITLPTGYTSKHIRLYYKATDDWGVALQRAPKTYNAVAADTDVTTLGPKPNNYYYDSSPSALTIYFPACDAGKSVLISHLNYTYYSGGMNHTASLGSAQAVIPEQVKSVGMGSAALLPITSFISLPSGGVLTSASFDRVTGLSTRAITIWRENNQWQERSLDGIVGRAL